MTIFDRMTASGHRRNRQIEAGFRRMTEFQSPAVVVGVRTNRA
jgi:hypothetical protein